MSLGKAGCRPHPWPACRKISRRQSPQDWPNNRPSLRDGLNGCSVLSQGTGLACPRHRDVADQDTSVGVSGPHGLTVRDLIVRPHAKRALRPDAATASHAPRSVTIAKRPFTERETARRIDLICPTAQAAICPTGCDKLARRAVWAWVGCGASSSQTKLELLRTFAPRGFSCERNESSTSIPLLRQILVPPSPAFCPSRTN